MPSVLASVSVASLLSLVPLAYFSNRRRLILKRKNSASLESLGVGSVNSAFVDMRALSSRLPQEELSRLADVVQGFDVQVLRAALTSALKAHAESETSASSTPPLPASSEVVDPFNLDRKVIDTYRSRALKIISEGRAASILLSGGQGTRLGANCPKGCLDIGLASRASLFELHAKRLKRLATIAAQATGKTAEKGIPWYIMTSEATHEDTIEHFENNNYFGLDRNDVYFFPQGMLPAMTKDGVAVLQGTTRANSLALSPDGNGGIYTALKKHGILDDMKKRRVVCCDAICVDNVLARPLDPGFVGCCLTRKADMGALAVEKAYAHEKVGVFVKARGTKGGLAVCEYSEMPKASSEEKQPDGKLRYRWGNICIHFYTADFLRRMASPAMNAKMPYHAAIKAVPTVGDAKVEAVKLERFIFDAFAFARNSTLYAARREESFAPIKNKAGPGVKDSPETARALLLGQHTRWLQRAGATVLDLGEVEISPGSTYEGEGLADVVRGKRVDGGLLSL